MHQVKFFKGMENELAELEEEVNRWLAEHDDVRVVNVFGNMAPQSGDSSQHGTPGLSRTGFPPSDMVLVVVYERT